jgi:hypothetical protein
MNNNSKGFTLVEVSAATTLLVVAMGLAIAGYMFTLKNINQGDVQNELDIDVQIAMENLKTDLRLSSMDKMFYHPEGGGPYEAISFPIAYDSDGDSLLEKNEDGTIIWDETVVYHIRPTTPHQLVKTTFNPRDNSLTDAQRQAQLESVIRYGDGKNTYNAQNATSDVLFENLLEWSLNPKAGRFDAYSADLTRDRASLGYMLMDGGSHDITFKAIDKNNNSKGYKIGIDQLFMSSSQSPREAEAQLPVKSQSGATALYQFMDIGSWKGDHQLYFPATAVGNSFTLTLPNDRWEETNFSGTGYLAEDTRVEFDKSLSPRDHVVMLDGMDVSWEAAAQTGSLQPVAPGAMQAWTVSVMQKGSELTDNGNWFSYNGRQCRLKFNASNMGRLRVHKVSIGETVSASNFNFTVDSSSVMPVTFNGDGSSRSNPIAPEKYTYSDWINFDIDKEKNYVVTYHIVNNPTNCHPAFWPDMRGSINPTSLIYTNGLGSSPIEAMGIVGLSSIEVSYPEEGTYSSQIFDTHLDAPQYGDISWNADIPAGTTLAFKVRTGNNADLSDASDWDSISAFSYPSSISASYKRYIQFQAIMTSDDPKGERTPKLKDVTINWNGTKQLVDVGGIFTKGPDYGIFEISVDGEPLKSALIVDLEIYEDERAMNNETIRVTSSLKVEITPRNSGF